MGKSFEIHGTLKVRQIIGDVMRDLNGVDPRTYRKPKEGAILQEIQQIGGEAGAVINH